MHEQQMEAYESQITLLTTETERQASQIAELGKNQENRSS